jgi:hypothetical protein
MYLDSFSLSCYHNITSDVNAPIPKGIAILKCILEDLPQFVIQMIYISKARESKEFSSLAFYIGLGLMSFGISMGTAITAKSSTIDEKTLVTEMQERKMKLTDSLATKDSDQEDLEEEERKEGSDKGQESEEDVFRRSTVSDVNSVLNMSGRRKTAFLIPKKDDLSLLDMDDELLD